jgi:Transcriptional regulators
LATIIDIAKKTGISKSTVSRVLSGNKYGVSESAIEKVLAAARELNYVKNQAAVSMRTNRTNTILLLIPDITNEFWSEVAKGVQDEMDKSGYSVVLANTDRNKEREKRYMDLAAARRFDAVLINTGSVSENGFDEVDCPIVLLGEKEHAIYPVVGTNSTLAVRIAAEYLSSLGHKKIAFVFSDSDSSKDSSRFNAYRECLGEFNLDARKEFSVFLPMTLEGGRRLAAWYIAQREKPSAIVTGNDLMSIGFIEEAKKAGIAIPSAVSIIGFDNISAGTMISPGLTTVAKPKYAIGQLAAKTVISLLGGGKVADRTLLTPELVVRETVKEVAHEK